MGKNPHRKVNSRNHAGNHTHPDEIQREIMEAEMRRAYSWNYYDNEIAEYVGCSARTVLRWRHRQDPPLPSNYDGPWLSAAG